MHCIKCGRNLQSCQVENTQETTSSCSFCTPRSQMMHLSPPDWHQVGNVVRSSKSILVIKCVNCSDTFSTFKQKYEHQIGRDCTTCDMHFQCLNEFKSHVRLCECKPRGIGKPPSVQCRNCCQRVESSSELLVHLDKCNHQMLGASCLNYVNQEPRVHITRNQLRAQGRHLRCKLCSKKSPCGCLLEGMEGEDDELELDDTLTLQSTGKCTLC
jgi:hypothetical protein